MKRRQAIKKSIMITGSGFLGSSLILKNLSAGSTEKLTSKSTEKLTFKNIEAPFKISLAQWSLHRKIYNNGNSQPNLREQLLNNPKSVYLGDLDPLDFPVVARREFGLDAVEYVNVFYFSRARDTNYLTDLKRRADGEGVKSLLIMCDLEGNLGDPDAAKRKESVENHFRWIDAAKFLGCHSIRVNARSSGSFEEQQKLAAEGLRSLCEFAEKSDINVIVENHGGLSSNGKWLSEVIQMIDHPLAGTLPDFGNFNLGNNEWYDRYKGVEELMPFARGVSAKSYDFDDNGNCIETDYRKMLTMVADSGYDGYIGIEYEGGKLSEEDGIKATKKLLETIFAEM
jgi:sugar phosphate isomerase/epimerase